MCDGGSPFFYLADTAWLLFNKLTEDDARKLFVDRSSKGFTVVQACVFRDLFKPNTANVAGVKPFASDDDMRAVRLNPDWVAHVVRVTKIAAEYGLTMGLLPTWGDKWNEHSNSAGPVIMDRASAREYCCGLSDALGECENVIWILGGDSPVRTQAEADTIRAMADGIRSGRSADHLISFHPEGQSSSAIFHSEPWLDFNAIQSSHFKPNFPNYLHIERLHAERPTKPVIDLEANYERIPMFLTAWHGLQPKMDVVFSAYDVRKAYYRSVLAGAAGHTYGCEPIRQVHRKGDKVHGAEGESMMTWDVALGEPGSGQLKLLKDTLLSRSYFTRTPAQELLRSYTQQPAWADPMGVGIPFAAQENTDPVSHIRVARCTNGSYLYVYMPVRQLLYLDVSGLASKHLRLTAHDPASGDVVDTFDFDMPRVEDTGATYATRVEDGMLFYVPRTDLDSFIIIDAI